MLDIPINVPSSELNIITLKDTGSKLAFTNTTLLVGL